MERGTDRRAGRTEPSDGQLALHPRMHEKPFTVAAYLGLDDVNKLARTIFIPRVVQITRLLYPLVANPDERHSLDRVFDDFFLSDSDAKFRRSQQATSVPEIREWLYDCAIGAWGSDDKPAALVVLLVYVFDLLSRDEDAPDTASQGSGHLEITGAQLDNMVEGVYDVVDGFPKGGRHVTSKRRPEEYAEEPFEKAQAIVTRFIPESPWTEDIRPKIRHYPEYKEHEFEKYCRIIALVRYCAREMLELATASRALGSAAFSREAGIMFPEGRAGTDNYKRVYLRSVHFAQWDLPVGQQHKPWWMRETQTSLPSGP
ncbi:uncharacterized protein PG986_000520 [Apiospora aurea]|uniref:Uncharacterized protein n=1 Tax=Apiospora aurea TaxID=335848 RepID=A0ABR1QUW6_9PEZI